MRDRSAGRNWKNKLRDVLPCHDVTEERLDIWRKGQAFGRRGARKELRLRIGRLRGWRTDSGFNRTG
jgi:hypothetical protein